MLILRRYSNPVLAEAAAEFLRQSSIAARTTARLGGDGITGATGGGVFELAILDAAQADRASQLLAELDLSPAAPEPGWEGEALPDLSRLDPRHRPKCPGCARLLPADDALLACPSCAAPVDIADLIVQQHGPEALAGCYPDEAASLPADLIDSARLSCPACQYPLDGLAAIGPCPECGRPYSKAELLRGWQ
jgi:hypothetical protein